MSSPQQAIPTLPMVQRLCAALCIMLPQAVKSAPAVGTPEQIAWQGQGLDKVSDMAVFIHYNMATAAGEQGCDSCSKGPPPPIKLWNPSALDTDSWIKEGMAMGATRFIYTAKHGCGFVAWKTLTNYSYSATNSPSLHADIVAAFVASAKKFQVQYGFYYNVMSNKYANVCSGKVMQDPVPGQLNLTQAEYDDLVISHLKELWGNYGDLGEIWFDGGYSSSLKPRLQELLKDLQPHAIVFGGEGLTPNAVRWVGTEAGHSPYPCWSTDIQPTSNSGGDPDGSQFIPAETDFTLLSSDQWFYMPNFSVHSPAELRYMYESSAGHNSPVIIDFAPFPNGSLPQDQVLAARKLGKFISGCYNSPIVTVNGSGDTARRLVLKMPSGNATIDRVLLVENMQTHRAQFVRNFTITAVREGGATQIVFRGSSIGAKFVFVLDKPLTHVQALVLKIKTLAKGSPADAPFISKFAALSCNALVARLDADIAPKVPAEVTIFM